MKKQITLSLILLVVILSRITAQDKLYPNTFSLKDVELLDGPSSMLVI